MDTTRICALADEVSRRINRDKETYLEAYRNTLSSHHITDPEVKRALAQELSRRSAESRREKRQPEYRPPERPTSNRGQRPRSDDKYVQPLLGLNLPYGTFGY